MLQTAPAWLVNLVLYGFCVRPVLQFVQFLPFESYPPTCLQSLPSRAVWRFKKQTLFIIQVINESNEQCQARPDSWETQNRGAQFIFLFCLQIVCNYWALFPISVIPTFHLAIFLFLAYIKLCQKPYENQDIWHLLLLPVSMVRITSSNDEIRWFDMVCSSESYVFSSRYLWIMAWVIFPVFLQELK